MLTSLFFQLKYLFQYTEKLVQIDFLEFRETIEESMVNTLRSKQRLVMIIMNLSILFVLVLFAIHTYWEHSYLIATETCTIKEMYPHSHELHVTWEVYAWQHMFLSAAINTWLLIITIKTLRLIHNNLNDLFKSEMQRINFIYWSFIVAYTSWMFFDFLQMVTPDNDGDDLF